MENGCVLQIHIIKMIIDLTEKEWIEVMKLVKQKSNGHFADVQNEYDIIKTKMLWQFGIQKNEKN